ncbi:MAG: hypothetical protein ABEJ89_02600, partial [Haloarculaceae archaeon]
DEFWVNASEPLASARSVWFHEYVHTRQSFALAPGMAWFREASAEYYAALLSESRERAAAGALSPARFGPPSNATLTDHATWAGGRTPRRRGARVLAALDRRIRRATDGHQSLEDVFRRLNHHDGRVTYEAFVQAVNGVAGTPMDGWLDRHVAGSAPVGDSAREVRAGGTVGGAGEVLQVFLPVSFALSLLASFPLYGLLRRLDAR